ncbi:hypothetical protein KP79_PYT15430 [Mizuhopecten yessoensis]|uniref:Uncharacterized protein n=1 Tax=Mizuhopecten yessoensis TaxID=6573 RepID=A0A210QB91_MIZYE|nr:hypothetical protein KP79_PYT15430 [Mizuhopecten yessoensis]
MNTRANPDRRTILDTGVQSRNALLGAERRFRRSCEQIVLLNQRLDQLQVRYDMAKSSSNRAFRYNLRLKLAVVEGMRNVYYDYAHNKAKMVANLRRDLFGETVEIIADDAESSDTSTDSIE